MIGQMIESRSSFPVGVVLWLLTAAGLGAIALAAKSPHPALLALMALFLGLALLTAREPPFAAVLTEQGIEILHPEIHIPYDSLQGLHGIGRPSDPTKPAPTHYPIQVVHDAGVLYVPRKLNVASDDIYFFLYEHFPLEGSRGVDPVLEEYLHEQRQMFGPDRVFAYRAREHLGLEPRWTGAAVSGALMLGGAAWLIIALVWRFNDYLTWAIWGGILAFFGLVFLIAYLAAPRSGVRIKNWRRASLVISPPGLALVQGDIKGEMHWDELRQIQFRATAGGFATNSAATIAGIILKFEGASITIADIYDQPLRMIYERIKQYWK
jgi:hypothetical protein